MLTPRDTPETTSFPVHAIGEEAKLRIREALNEMNLSEEGFYRNLNFLDKLIVRFIERTHEGVHVVDAPFNGGHQFTFMKHDKNSVLEFSSNVFEATASIAINMLKNPFIPLRLHSFLDVVDGEITEINPKTPQEMRCWLIGENVVVPLISQQVIDICCTDFENDKLLSPDRSTSYLDGWAFPEFSVKELGQQ